MAEPKKPFTLALSKQYLEPFAGCLFADYLGLNRNNIVITNDDSVEDKILKVDLKNTNKVLSIDDIKNRKNLNIITGQVKTHEPENNYLYHPEELENNDYFIFYEKEFDEEYIKNNLRDSLGLFDSGNIINYINNTNIYVISSDKIKELKENPVNGINDRGSHGEYYVIPEDTIKKYAYKMPLVF